MKSKLKMGKRVLSVFMAVLMVMTAWVFVAPEKAEAGYTKASSLESPNVYFYVPEAIYLKPALNSAKNQQRYSFQWQVDASNADSPTTLYQNEYTTGNIYFHFTATNGVTIKYRYLNNDFSVMATYSTTSENYVDSYAELTMGGQTIKPYNKTSSSAYTATGSNGETKVATSCSAGMSPYLLAATTGCYIEWTASYTDLTDGKAKTVYAYTYVYKPFVQPVGVGVCCKEKYWNDHFNGYIAWVSGVHKSANGSRYPKSAGGEYSFVPFSSGNNTGYSKRGDLYMQFTTNSEHASDNYFDWTSDNTGCGSWMSTSATTYFSVPSLNYYSDDEHNPSGSSNLSAYVYVSSPLATIAVDSSRYDNLSKVPNLSVGMMITDDESSDSGGAQFIKNYSTGTTADTQANLSGYQQNGTRTNAENLWKAGNGASIFSAGTHGSGGASETEGIKYNGRWTRTISTSSASGHYDLRTGVWNKRGGDWCTGVGGIRVQINMYNKDKLRKAVWNATQKMAKLGVNGLYSAGKPTSLYFDNNDNFHWVKFRDTFQKAVRVLCSVDMQTGISDSPDTIATELNNALADLYTKVTFSANYGGTLKGTATQYLLIGTNKSAVINPTAAFGVSVTAKTGYKFLGWSTSNTASSGAEDVTVGYNDYVYAVYSVKVTFLDATGRVINNDYYVPYGTAATAPANPTKLTDEAGHYEFDKWEEDYSNVTAPLTVHPKFTTSEHKYTNYTFVEGSATCETDGVEKAKCDLGCNRENERTKAGSALGHDWEWVIDLENTCGVDGRKHERCTRPGCGATRNLNTVIEKTGNHDYSLAAQKTEAKKSDATCTTPLTYYYSCAVCGQVENNDSHTFTVGNELGHVATKEVIDREPTCTLVGLKHYECTRTGCDYCTEQEEIEMLDHVYLDDTWHEVSSPSCEGSGLEENYCSSCHGARITRTIRPNGHDWETDYTIDRWETCTEKGEKSIHCKNCEARTSIVAISAPGHQFNAADDVVVPPTCFEDGYTLHVCSRVLHDGTVCGGTEKFNFVDKNDHIFGEYTADRNATCTWVGTKTAHCTRVYDGVPCEGTDTIDGDKALGHDFIITYDDNVSCTTGGTRTVTCSRCDYESVEEQAPVGHEFKASDYVSDGNAKCGVNGTKTAQCANVFHGERCTETRTIEDKGSALTHIFADDDWVTTTDPGCTTAGEATHYCTRYFNGVRCDGYETKPIPKNGHTPGEKVDENVKPATCTVNGSKDEVVYCTVCHEELSRDNVTLEAPGHKESEPVEDIITEESCLDPGYSEFNVYCSVCGYKIRMDHDSVRKALGHTESEWIVDPEPQCTKRGKRHTECIRCGKLFKSEYLEELGHIYNDPVVIDPTCTERGYTQITCAREGCKYDSRSNWVPKLDHNPGEEVIDPESIVETSCKAPGSYEMIVRCEECSLVLERNKYEIPALKHTPSDPYETEDHVAPSCTTPGSHIMAVSCTVCGKLLDRKTVEDPATGHAEGVEKIDNIKKATCTSDGSHDIVIYCPVCEMTISSQTIVDPATGHKAGDPVIENNKNASCDRPGSYDTVTYCTVCNKEMSRVTTTGETLPHTPGDWEVAIEPTCHSVGMKKIECERCGQVLEEEEIGMTRHVYDDGVVTEPTCTSEGYTTYSCTNDGCTESYTTDTVEMKPHDYKDTTVNSTCSEEGYTKHVCSVCGDTYKDNYQPTIDHTFGGWSVTFAGTCIRPSITSRFCLICGFEDKVEGELGTHVKEVVKGKPATCEEDGLTDGIICSECNEVLKEQKAISALGHADNDMDHKCDHCGEDYVTDCNCICHKKSGIMKFVFAIVNFFWRLFKISKTCYCGKIHY